MVYSVDIPLEDESSDVLNRGPFAKLVADALLAECKPQATVIGLNGGWGTGKSTVANFVVKRITTATEQAKIVRVEPWMVSSSEALVREFFKELGKAILPQDASEEAKEKTTLFYKYAALVLDGLVLSADVGNMFGVPFSGLLSKSLRGGKIALDHKALSLEAQSRIPTLREARNELNQALRGMKRPVVVVIDDIDRLNAMEVRTVFQLVKACADFPNVRYLLLFDRDQVIHALSGTVISPEAFLEKVINQTFDLPEMTTKQRATLLNHELKELNMGEGIAGNASYRLSKVVDEVLLPGLPTVRHVKRFVNTVRTLIPGVIVEGYRNVDPGDFLALEFLRQYVPELYRVLREEEAPVPGGLVLKLTNSEGLAEQRKSERDKATPAEEPMRALATEALNILSHGVDNREGVRRAWVLRQHNEKRFYSEYWRPVYLGFAYSRAALPDQCWEAIRKSLQVPAQDYAWLNRLNDAEGRTILANAVSARADELTLEEAKNLFEAIISWGEKQTSQRYASTSGLIDPMKAVYLIGTSCLVRIQKQKDAGNIVLDVLDRTQAVCCIGYISGMEHEEIKEFGSGHWSSNEGFKVLSDKLTPMLRLMVESDEVFDHVNPNGILDAWECLDREAAYQTWFDDILRDPSRLAKFVNKVMTIEMKQEGFPGWGGKQDSPLFQALLELDERVLTEDGRRARALFINSVRRRS